MHLLIVRHGDAGDSEEFAKSGQPDRLRPLSKKGRTQMRDVARGLLALVPEADLMVTSPYTRAVQTEEIVRRAYGDDVAVETSGTLEPERAPDDFAQWLRAYDDAAVVIAVGHEPHLSTLATWLMTGVEDSRIELKKGGACLLEFDGRPRKGAGTLRWLMGPKALRRMARRAPPEP